MSEACNESGVSGEMHDVVNDAINGHFVGIAHASNRITVIMLGICVWHTDTVAPDVAAEKLLTGSFISDDNTISEGAGDRGP